MNPLNDKKYMDKINMYLTFSITIVIMLLIGYIISVLVPNSLDQKYISENYILPIQDFVAEQAERLQYIILTITCPILFVCIYKILQRIDIKVKDYKKAYNVFSIINVIIIIGLIIYCCKYHLIKQAIIGSYNRYYILYIIIKNI